MAGRTTPKGKGPQGWKPLERPATVQDLVSNKKPVYQDVPVVLDSDLARWFTEAQEAAAGAASRRDVLLRISEAWPGDEESPRRVAEREAAKRQLGEAQRDADAAEEELAEARAAVEPVARQIRVRSIGPDALQELRDLHEPTDDQVAEHKAEWDKAVAALPEDQRGLAKYQPLDVNPDSYHPALLAACAVEPKLTYDEAHAILHSDKWSEMELFQLIDACKAVQLGRPQVDLGKGSGRKPVSA